MASARLSPPPFGMREEPKGTHVHLLMRSYVLPFRMAGVQGKHAGTTDVENAAIFTLGLAWQGLRRPHPVLVRFRGALWGNSQAC